MLPRQIWIPRKYDSILSVRIIPNRLRNLLSIGDIHNQGTHGIGAIIKADAVFVGAH
jgi:hypothetical protein